MTDPTWCEHGYIWCEHGGKRVLNGQPTPSDDGLAGPLPQGKAWHEPAVSALCPRSCCDTTMVTGHQS